MPQPWKDHALAGIGGVSVEDVRAGSPVGTMIEVGARTYSAALPTPRPLTPEQLATLPMPVYVALASDSSLAGSKAAEQARRIPDATVVVWPRTTHSLPMQAREPLDKALLEFWSAHE